MEYMYSALFNMLMPCMYMHMYPFLPPFLLPSLFPPPQVSQNYCIVGIFRGGGGKIFVVFVVEKRTTKFLPTKQYRIVPGVV